MKSQRSNLIDSLAMASPSRQMLERRVAQMGIGVLAALQNREMTFEDARRELFNLDNYQAVKRHRLAAKLAQFFEWGMELADVAEIAPEGLPESYRQMRKLASRVMARSRNGRAAARTRLQSRRA